MVVVEGDGGPEVLEQPPLPRRRTAAAAHHPRHGRVLRRRLLLLWLLLGLLLLLPPGCNSVDNVWLDFLVGETASHSILITANYLFWSILLVLGKFDIQNWRDTSSQTSFC